MMPKLVKKRSHKSGLPPGTLVHIGEQRVDRAKITIFDYDEVHFEEKEAKAIEECFLFKDRPTVTWINIDGLHQVDIIEKLGNHFGLHPLMLEDVVNTEQRPKMEDYGDYIFLVLKMLYHREGDVAEIEAEQVSLILGSNFVISLQEHEGDVFGSVRDRIRNNKGRIRKAGPDYLAYSLLDAVVDSYFALLEVVGEKIVDAEQELAAKPTPGILQLIHKFKRGMIFLRKSVWPLREVTSSLQRCESLLIHESTSIYLRDVYDHTIQVIDTVENYGDLISGMLDIYISSISNKMNEVMKVLTIFASIFIPLTFIAGVYGMNFTNMPELQWRYGYFVLLGVMALVALLLVAFFKKRKWL
jgi:magnesium transporter